MAVMKKRSQKKLYYNECMYSTRGCTCGHEHWQISRNSDHRKKMTKTIRRKEERFWRKELINT